MLRIILVFVAAVPAALLLAPALIVAGALFAFASVVRWLGQLLEPSFVPWSDLMMFDPYLGWRPRADLDTRYLASRDDIYRVITDEEGWPGRHRLADSTAVVIGDSFAFGYGVQAGSTFADLVPGARIKAVGAPGYNMVHGVLLMEEFGARLNGKLVVWFICLENDVQDNLSPGARYRSPFAHRAARTGTWDITRRHVSAEQWHCSDLGFGRILEHLCVPGPIADRAFDACDYLVGRASAACAAHGASLVLVTIPDPTQLTESGRRKLAASSGTPEAFDAGLPDRRFAEICRRHGVPMIEGRQHLTARDYKPIEALHWNQRGHRTMAGLLKELLDSFAAGQIRSAGPVLRGPAGDRVSVLHESAAASAR